MEPEHHSQFPEASEQHPVPAPYRWNPTGVSDPSWFCARGACHSDDFSSGDTVIFSGTANPRVVSVVCLAWAI